MVLTASMAVQGMWVSVVLAYQEAAVTNGGTVSGKVSYKGTPPPPEHVRVLKNADVCGNERDMPGIDVKNGALRQVVVLIEGIEKGKPLSSNVVDIVGRKCAFLPFLTVVSKTGKGRKGSPYMTVLNEDDVIHNPHPFEMGNKNRRTLWNIGLPEKGSSTKKQLVVRKSSVVKLECDQHNFMMSWTRVVTNPYWAIVSEDGTYSIDQILPGTYQLLAWHPILGEQAQEITVGENGSVTASFTYSGK